MPTDFQWYTLRAIDAILTANIKKAIVYTKFPGMILTSVINQSKLEGWVNTKIENSGEIIQPQEIKDDSFGTFLIDRFNWIRERKGTTTEIEPRILKAALRDPDKALESKTFEVSLIEAKRERDKIVRTLHPAVQGLIELAESIHMDQNAPSKFRLYSKYDGYMIAEKLSTINEYDELKIAYLMETTIKKAKITGKDSKFVFEGDRVEIIFMINLYHEQNERGKLVCTELNEAMKKRPNGNCYFLVVSWNPSETYGYICKCFVDYEKIVAAMN